jgi:hypothetical protein
MLKGVFAVLLALSLQQVLAQARYAQLIIGAKETYTLRGGDILVADTLIMADSATLALTDEKREYYLHAAYLRAGRGCRILGKGAAGQAGKPGRKGATPDGPCADGGPGRGGTGGSHGDHGRNLSLYLKALAIDGSLTIDLSGGDGGNGGAGGEGGGGGPGTVACNGGNGGAGGQGATGGNGGNGGNLTIVCKDCGDVQEMINQKIFVRTFGGSAGRAGDAGSAGAAGLAPQTKDGKPGAKGLPGTDGTAGKSGGVFFNIN